MKKGKIIKGIIISCIIGVIFGCFIGCGIGLCHLTKNRAAPIRYCISEISKHENYDTEFTYIYQELESTKEVRNSADSGCDLYAYYITTFTDDRKGEWYCFVEFKQHRIPFIAYDIYAPEDLVIIDCDLAFETLYS